MGRRNCSKVDIKSDSSMLDNQPDIRAGHVWERLIDDHDANVFPEPFRVLLR